MATDLPRSPTTLQVVVPTLNQAVKINPSPGTRAIRLFPVAVDLRFGFEGTGNAEGGALVLAVDLVQSEWLEVPWDPGSALGTGFFLELTSGAPGTVQLMAVR